MNTDTDANTVSLTPFSTCPFLQVHSQLQKSSSQSSLLSSTKGSSSKNASANTTITAVDVCENNIFIATSDCYVSNYVIESSNASTPRLHQRKLFPKPISSIISLPTEGKLLLLSTGSSLADSMLTFHDISTFQAVSLPSYKGASCMAQDVQVHSPARIAFGKRRGLVILSIDQSNVKVEKDVPLQETPLRIALNRSVVLVADANAYTLLLVSTSSVIPPTITPLFSFDPSMIIHPQMLFLTTSEMLPTPEILITNGSIGIILNLKGDPIRGTLAFSEPPLSIAWQFPYVLALLRDGRTVEVHNFLEQKLVQTWKKEDGGKLENFYSSLIPVYDFWKTENVKFNPLQVVLAGKDFVEGVKMESLNTQVETLIGGNKLLDALRMRETCFNKENGQWIHQRVGIAYFQSAEFDEAYQQFKIGKLPVQLLAKLMDDVDGLVTRHLEKTSPEADEETRKSFKTALVEHAQDVYQKYLVYARNNAELRQSTTPKEIIDETLIRIYAKLDNEDSSLMDFIEQEDLVFTLQNVELVLKEYNRHYALSLLYAKSVNVEGKRPLGIWMALISGKLQDATVPGDTHVILLKKCEELLIKKKSLDLTLLFFNWLFGECVFADKGLYSAILSTGAKVVMTDALCGFKSIDDVIEFIEDGFGNVAGETKWAQELLVSQILEWAVFVKGVDSAHVHERLVARFFTDLESHYDASVLKKTELSYKALRLRPIFPTYLSTLVETHPLLKTRSAFIQYVKEKRIRKSRNREDSLDMIAKLEKIEKGRGGEFVYEKALFYAELNDHEKVLELIVKRLSDLASAEIYINQQTSADNDLKKKLFSKLLGFYLESEATTETNKSEILSLLNMYRHSRDIDFLSTLKNIPSSWTLKELELFLCTQLSSTGPLFSNQVQKGLLRAQSVNIRGEIGELMVGETGKVVLGKGAGNSICHVCGKIVVPGTSFGAVKTSKLSLDDENEWSVVHSFCMRS